MVNNLYLLACEYTVDNFFSTGGFDLKSNKGNVSVGFGVHFGEQFPSLPNVNAGV